MVGRQYGETEPENRSDMKMAGRFRNSGEPGNGTKDDIEKMYQIDA